MKHEHLTGAGDVKPFNGGGRDAGDSPALAAAGAGDQTKTKRKQRPKIKAPPLTGQLVVGTPQTFSFNGRAFQAIYHKEVAWFLASEVCAALEHSNPRLAVSRLEPDERGVTTIDTPGGHQEANVVSESGLYQLVNTSRKPQAKVFRRWVTGEVLPAIRKTGRYEMGGKQGRAGLEVDDELYLALSMPGRTIVTVLPDGKRHIHRTEYDAMLGEILATDCRLLSYALKTTEGFWNKAQQMRSVDRDLTGGFAIAKLEGAILEGGRLAAHYLRCYKETSD